MNKAELVAAVALETGDSSVVVRRVLNGILAAVSSELSVGGDVVLAGFGSFKPGKRTARSGRNPANGNPVEISASNTVRFAAGTTLKDALNAVKK